ncbi:MAG: TonB-dependent receptor plug domain-containing protein [Spongiibacteraceae bacterium]
MRCTQSRRNSSVKARHLLLLAMLAPGLSLAATRLPHDLTELSLEELLDIDVQVTARKGETLRESSAAVYIINRDAIRRSGATSIPEILRLAPGVEVTRFGNGKWGVGIRGFNGGTFTNRLLILVDGRSVFSPAKIGMFWDTLDTLIEDIERIEVVRGPGTALWGANAFNGVINIVSRHSQDTQGGLVSVGGGDEEKWFASARIGGAIGGGTARGYIKAFERDDAARFDGGDNHDGWTSMRGGMRFDIGELETGSFSLMLDAYQGSEGEELILPDLNSPTLESLSPSSLDYSGQSLQTKWQKQASKQSLYELTFSADHSERKDTLFDLSVNSYELNFQHNFQRSQRQQLIWGAGARYTEDKLPTQYIQFTPERREYSVVSAFAQYEYRLPSQNLRFIAGSKIEHNDFSDVEMQPNARIVWTPTPHNSIWLAVSEANRTPSRTEHDSTITLRYVEVDEGVILLAQIRGSHDFNAEKLRSHELGWRWQRNSAISVDTALFYNEYTGLRTVEPTQPIPISETAPQLLLPLIASNTANAKSWGGELVITAALHKWWQLEFHYSHIQILVDPRGSGDPDVENAEGESPQHRATLQSSWTLPGKTELSATLRYVDDVDKLDIDDYRELDLTLSKQISPQLTLSLVGRNLLDKAHQEYVDTVVGTPRSEVERSAYLKLMWKF